MPNVETVLVALEPVARLLLVVVLAAALGWERERRGRPAGFRTYIMVGLGAAMFTLVSIYAFPGSDPARVAAQVVTGVGFLGAGTIFQRQTDVHGLTTAAGLWAVAAIAMAAAAGLYLIAVVGTLLAMLTLAALRGVERRAVQSHAVPPAPPEGGEGDAD
ncbi:MAG: MgtC/SapB family protein [Chloroflexi bacterium]|nr:MgtC/SapB family protein [Chloroflexota bacterium]